MSAVILISKSHSVDILKHIESFIIQYDPKKHTYNNLSSISCLKGIE